MVGRVRNASIFFQRPVSDCEESDPFGTSLPDDAAALDYVIHMIRQPERGG